MLNANLVGAGLQEANVVGANLAGATLRQADLQRVSANGVQLQGALLTDVNGDGADLRQSSLERARLDGAQLRNADLSGVQLASADLRGAHLERTILVGASFDKASRLNNTILTSASLDQVTFENTNLSVVDWRLAPILGDELTAQSAKDENSGRKPRSQRIEEYQAAARAYRRLAMALQANGLSEETAGYLYRAQIMQRRLAYRERRFGAYLFSVLLAVLAGYGYRLGRIVVAYLSVVLFFAVLFLSARYVTGGVIYGPQVADALQISLNAIHGRVFFAQFGLDTAQSWIATIESVVGIVIEGVFVAMLIQRFFGK
jgi:hypothetical protein